MIDKDALQEYNEKMDRLISEHNAKNPRKFVPNFHYVLEDSEIACCKRDQEELENMDGYAFIRNIPRYNTLSRNYHHWTTKYVWERFIPRFCRDFALPFDPSDFDVFKHIERENGKEYDLSFHCPKEQGSYSYYDDKGCAMGSHTHVMREFIHSPSIYHGLFRGWHKCCIVRNYQSYTGRTLFINCDSMSIPVIPILIRYYDAILVADNRDDTEFLQKTKEFLGEGERGITDWCTLALARSYCVSNTFQYRETSNNKIYRLNMQ